MLEWMNDLQISKSTNEKANDRMNVHCNEELFIIIIIINNIQINKYFFLI